jgi:hypothetical protein
MPCLATNIRSLGYSQSLARRAFTNAARRRIREVPVLSSWDPPVFKQAYQQAFPVRLPRSRAHLPPACWKWFIHESDVNFNLFKVGRSQGTSQVNVPASSELLPSFWSDHDSVFVPLEVTTKRDGEGGDEEFERIEAPLKMLLAYLARGRTTPRKTHAASSIYLAQCDLSALSELLQADVPLPKLLQTSSSGAKGDIYASSLWLGRPPTYTPLHRDPNPNLFIQLAGRKTIRLLPPEVGDRLYHDLITRLSPGTASFSSRIRGEEMMAGREKKALHDAVWDESDGYGELVRTYGFETTLGLGETLFTPKGWWHSVKGVGEGVTASVNWWFR